MWQTIRSHVRKTAVGVTVFSLFLFQAHALAADKPLDETIAAHGSRSTWDGFGTVSYKLEFTAPGGFNIVDTQTFNLKNRAGRIEGSDYTIVGSFSDGVWVKTDEWALPFPPRFYLWTPFYFFASPFVFDDAGAIQEKLPEATFEGKTYNVTKITYGDDVGDAPDDYYITYTDPETHQLKLLRYIVTYFPRNGEKPEPPKESVMLIDEWQTVSGLTVPKAARFFFWNDGNLGDTPKLTMTFNDVAFSEQTPPESSFEKPDGAVRDELPTAGR